MTEVVVQPAQEVQELPRAVEAESPIQQRIHAIEGQVKPENITRLNKQLIEHLMMIGSSGMTSQSEQRAFSEVGKMAMSDPKRFFQDLKCILENTDLVELLLSNLNEKDPQRLVEEAQVWKEGMVARLQGNSSFLPERVVSEKDYFDYMFATSLFRPGKEEIILGRVFPEEIAARGLGYLSERAELTHPNPAAFRVIINAAGFILANDFGQKDKANEAALNALSCQEKWMVLGGDHELEPVTEAILTLLADFGSKEAVKGIVDSLFRRGLLDSRMIAYTSLISERPILQEFLVRQIRTYFKICFQIDPDASRAALLSCLGETIFRPNFASEVISEAWFAMPEIQVKEIPVSPDRKSFRYYGNEHNCNLPEGATLEEIHIGFLVVRDKNGEVIGALSLVNPEISQEAEFLSLDKIQPSILGREADPALIKAFLEDYSLFSLKLTEWLGMRMNPNYLFLPSVFELWDYLKDNPGGEKEIAAFLKEYGLQGLVTFLVSAYGRENLPLLVKFGLEAQEPKEREEEGIQTIRLRESFTERVVKEYMLLVRFASRIASVISSDPQRASQIEDMILRRAKSMLIAAAKLHQKRGLTKEDEIYIKMSFYFYSSYLDFLMDPKAESAKELNMPVSLPNFFRYHDLTDPDIAAIYRSAEERWFHFWAKRQKQYAPYAGKVSEINTLFYQEYEEVEVESGRQTADPERETRRFIAADDWLLRMGLFPKDAEIRSDGCGSALRVDAKLNEHLKENSFPVKWPVIGIDLLAHDNPPPDMEIIQGDVVEVLKQPEHWGRYGMVRDIWPGPIPDSILLDQVEAYIEAVTTSLKKGGVFICDLPLPVGKGSYASLLQAYTLEHRREVMRTGGKAYEPPGIMLERGFERPGKPPVEKKFLILHPEMILGMAAKRGLYPLNLPLDYSGREKIYALIAQDDSILKDRNDAMTYPFWQTGSGWNRMTLIFINAELPEEVRAKLPKVSYGPGPA